MTTSSILSSSLGRRSLIKTGLAISGSGCITTTNHRQREFESAMLGIAEQFETRLGVMAINSESGQSLSFGADRRFPMASTFKLLLVAFVLHEVDRGQLTLGQKLAVTEDDMVFHAPVTEQFVGKGFMSVNQLCAATMVTSDNPAANILLRAVGGPAMLTAFMRAQGDTITRLDRYEPELNSNESGDLRDTTTPRAMAQETAAIVNGKLLSEGSRTRFIEWLVGAKTGLKRLRAGIPESWRAGDKTGTGYGGLVNDVMVAWPPGRRPWVVALYLNGSPRPVKELSFAHVAIARQIVAIGSAV